MTHHTRSAGLSIGAVLTLTLGFLVASLLIFVFGIWVGKDLVERRLAQEERIVRKPADHTALGEPTPPRAEAPAADVPAGWLATPTPVAVAEPATPRPVRVVAATTTPVKVAVVPTPTVRIVERPTAAPTAPRAARRGGEEWADAGWTVQVYATTDPNQATALARRLLAKGYDAYTLQAPMRGQMWYRVRVGRFASRERAREMEQKLKTLEALEAAYVTAQ